MGRLQSFLAELDEALLDATADLAADSEAEPGAPPRPSPLGLRRQGSSGFLTPLADVRDPS